MLYIPIVLLFLLGSVFLGQGITGFVVSQSCCLPPDCAVEDMCPFAKPYVESPHSKPSYPYLYIGMAIVAFSIVLYVALNRKLRF